jgi:hypothetical protein
MLSAIFKRLPNWGVQLGKSLSSRYCYALPSPQEAKRLALVERAYEGGGM